MDYEKMATLCRQISTLTYKEWCGVSKAMELRFRKESEKNTLDLSDDEIERVMLSARHYANVDPAMARS